MIAFANAKINIGLNIIEKREDGFHNIESVFYPIQCNDIIEIIPKPNREETLFESSGIEIPGLPENNLILKAYHLLKKDFSLPGSGIYLHKLIPIGAGLGGGSSDGACAIKLINQLFDLQLSQAKMLSYAGKLGSDCPFFILNKPSFATEKGNQLNPIDLNLNSFYLCLVYPKIFVSTQEAYSAIVPAKATRSLLELVKAPVSDWKENITNDFEGPVFSKYPLIKELKEFMYKRGAVYASMSGSGSSVYGIFNHLPQLNKELKNYFVWEEKMNLKI